MSPPHHRPLRVGTRGSPLALAQARQIARQLHERCGRPTVLVTVATPGDETTAPIERRIVESSVRCSPYGRKEGWRNGSAIPSRSGASGLTTSVATR